LVYFDEFVKEISFLEVSGVMEGTLDGALVEEFISFRSEK
tara:strand:+ start:30843 stop:30962 length:120 start_codon:yes stop_codon:yes gene_type:complete